MATARGSDWDFGFAEATRMGKMFTPEALGISPALTSIAPMITAQSAMLQPLFDQIASSQRFVLEAKLGSQLAKLAPTFTIADSMAKMPGLDIVGQFGPEIARISSLGASLSASTVFQLPDMSKLGRIDTSWMRSHATTSFLESAFRETSGTPMDSLGTLRGTLARDPDLGSALDSAVGAVGTSGALGVDFSAVRDRVEELSARIDGLERDERREVDAALEAAADATHTAAEGVREQAAVLGLGLGLARKHRRSIGIVVAYTAGLGWLVCDLAEGNPLVPTTLFGAAGIGVTAYGWVVKRLR